MAKSIPIYIISYNRLTVLQESITSYLQFANYEDIIILDNGSDYEPLLQYLKSLEEEGVLVKYLPLAETREKRAALASIIKDENTRRGSEYYVVTDPDISFNNVSLNLLEIYIELLEKLKVDVVGPMLTIKDIPKDYPIRELAWKKHVEQFWMYKPKHIQIQGEMVFYQKAKIDTTFGLFRTSTPWRRLVTGIRVYNPYEAKHLDWYFTKDNIPEDQLYYSEKVKSVEMAHWSGAYLDNKPISILPNFLRKIYLVKDGKVETHCLPKVKFQIGMLSTAMQVLSKRIMKSFGVDV